MSLLEIREATAADIPALAHIEKECFPDPWSEGALTGHLQNKATLTLLVTLDGQIAGELLLGISPPEGEIYRIATLPAVRRRGLGGALLRAGLCRAREAGVFRLFLDVRASNEAARALYTTHGFTETGVRRDYYRLPREDAVLMEREVSS